MVARPEQHLWEIPLLTEAQKSQLFMEWNNTQADYSQEQCIHQLFEVQVEHTPNAIAVIFEDQHLTYRELNTKANQLAHYLQKLGVKPEVLVGVCVERSLSMVIGILAILKAGGAYVPLDPAYPQERLAFMLSDSKVLILLSEQQLLKDLPEHQTRIVCLDTDGETIAKESQHNPSNSCTADNLAYLIYTSGSTGQPKGVLVNHQNVTRLLAATQSWFNFNSQDVWTLFHSIAFDFSVWEIWGALLWGGRLVVVPYFISRSPESFYKLLCQQQVTVLNQTPSAFRQLIRAEASLETAKQLALRLVIFGGESLELQSLKPWFELHGDRSPQLVNMYGITETTVHVTYRPLTLADLKIAASSVIGRPIPDLQVYLLDQHQQPVPIGVWGEMYIGGAGLTRGYLNRPELTAQKFISSPFSNQPEARLYKSGDLARYLPNGEFEYLGRIDNQVKIRGFRIEIGEIETLLTQHPSVRKTVVLVQKPQGNEKQLVAYVVPNTEQSPTISQLRNFLKQQLPEYMIPAVFIILEALPLTPNGKVDRNALPAPENTRPELDEVFVAPFTPEEKILAEIWAEVIGLEQVGIHDNFFALGGDSIRSIQVRSKARERGLNISLQQLFQHQTIHELIQNLTIVKTDLAIRQRVQAFDLICQRDRLKLQDSIEDAYPLTSLQMGMLFHSEYSPETAIYHDIFSYYFKAILDLPLLQKAIKQLVSLHPVLRTSFSLGDFSEPLQLVYHTIDVPLQVENLCHLCYAEQEKAITTWIEVEKSRHFDWACPPLMRFQIHNRSEETFQFTLSFHHAILDGWSVASMLTELFEQYFYLLGEKVTPLEPPPKIGLRDFVALERKVIESQEHRDFWFQKLSQSTISTIPRWSSAEKVANNKQINIQEVFLTPEVSQGLRQLAHSTSVPLKTVLLAVHIRVMSLLTGHSEVTTGLVSNGRPEESDGERVLGLFLNTLPFSIKLPGGTWIDLVRETFETERELLPFRRYPLAIIQKEFGGQPLFETIFNFTHFHVYQSLQKFGKQEILGGTAYERTNFTFCADFRMDLSSSEIQLVLTGDGTKLCHKQMEVIGGYYARTLNQMAGEPLARYESGQLLGEQELHQLLVEWNNTQADYPKEQLIHQLFENQVEHTPDAIAVVFKEQQLTYRELNAQANQLAHYLQKLGVKPEVLVGVYMERSLEMVVGLLGILKAGGAYVPLDPGYPQERLAFMLEDSQAKVLLTQTHLVELFAQPNVQVVCVDNELQLLTQQSTENLWNEVKSHHLAYVIYTSGSTGIPKGVAIEHQNCVALLTWSRDVFTDDDLTGVLASTSICFDLSIFELFVPLSWGGRVILVENALHLPSLTDEVSLVNTVPSIITELLKIDGLPASVRTVNLAGESLQNQLVQQIYQNHHIQRVLNLYGPSEDTTYSTFAEINRDSSVTIGRPIANTQIYLLDTKLQPVPIGVTGEIYIGGNGLARCYLNNPKLTAEKFIPNPFSDQPGARLYKTGDLARYLSDGNIEFIGRRDRQVKIRGFRIELGEIEALLIQHPEVRESVVIARVDHPGDKHLVAYVVPRPETTPSVSDLRQFLKQKLPDYMIPTAFVLQKELPLTPNGKIDRQNLPAPDTIRPKLQKNFVAPRDILELQLVQILEGLLNISPIGVTNNFFDLGGHSLLAVRLMAQIHKQFGQKLLISTLFQGATIEQLASILRQSADSVRSSPLVAIQPHGSKPPLFFVHPIGGNVLCYYELARHLEPDQPFYGLQSLGLDGESQPHNRIEDMATDYIKALRLVQSQGPYFLGGWSMGGVVAFEMAQQLQRQGHQVALLALLDTLAPVASNKPAQIENYDSATVLINLAWDMANSAGKNCFISEQHLQQLEPEKQLNYFLEQAKIANLISLDIGIEELCCFLRVFQSNNQALLNYQPQIYPHRIQLFRASERTTHDLDNPTLGWDKLSSEALEIIAIPGNHYTMLGLPHIQELKQRLNYYLHRD
ncbi:MAG: amino acid adenylation domain-containing protein [Desmonostoc geniculatum HA4340-LM1]|jgi:amino acid adenylation domain-containing protein|nr:amino acid adenylation domain-containing protein [Desmonostoc geniculatum HA4340-LM1]